jgi:drug/metabolite transporter (DMT)-like permease
MLNVSLFAATVLIWGTSWIAIAWQIDSVSVLVSVFYRFALAGLLFPLGLAVLGRLTWPSQWRFVVVQALCLFCFNFLCFYKATTLMPSGLVSVIFSLATVFNAVNARIFYGERVRARVLLAGGIGATGIVLLFWHDLAVSLDLQVLAGMAWAAMGTMLFSLGNMVSRRNTALGVPPMIANAWGMPMGALTLLGIVLLTGAPLEFPASIRFVGALAYLSIVGSIIGFTTYLVMVARLGSDRAAYATVLFPVVALMLSTLFEGFEWHATALVGVAMTMLGNLVMFARLPRRVPV